MKKLFVLLAALVVVAQIGLAYDENRATRFNDVRVGDLRINGGDILDSDANNRVLVSTGNVAVTGVGLTLYSRTIAQLNAITPANVGQMFLCNNCTQSPVCISSGTGTGAFVILASTGTFAGATFSGMTHCQ